MILTGLTLNICFLKRKWTAGALLGPDLTKLFDDVELDNNWEQQVPQSILTQLGLTGSSLSDLSSLRDVGATHPRGDGNIPS